MFFQSFYNTQQTQHHSYVQLLKVKLSNYVLNSYTHYQCLFICVLCIIIRISCQKTKISPSYLSDPNTFTKLWYIYTTKRKQCDSNIIHINVMCMKMSNIYYEHYNLNREFACLLCRVNMFLLLQICRKLYKSIDV